MKTTLALATGLISIAALVGCDGSNSSNGTGTQTPPPSANPPSRNAPPPAAPDNTGANKRDASGHTKTPMDQGNNQSDIDITANIRKAVMDDKAMSTNAQNCKIITEKGAVTLRGVVGSQTERDSIEAKAKAVAGVISVDNQLEVKKPS
jgi:hypothetical protein